MSKKIKHGNLRVVEEFLWLPMYQSLPLSEGGNRELRWLENAKILQRFVQSSASHGTGYWEHLGWAPKKIAVKKQVTNKPTKKETKKKR